jgi:hypothetical protein
VKYANYKELVILEVLSNFKTTLPSIFTLLLSTRCKENKNDIKLCSSCKKKKYINSDDTLYGLNIQESSNRNGFCEKKKWKAATEPEYFIENEVGSLEIEFWCLFTLRLETITPFSMNPTSRALRVYLKKKGFHDNKIIHWTNV